MFKKEPVVYLDGDCLYWGVIDSVNGNDVIVSKKATCFTKRVKRIKTTLDKVARLNDMICVVCTEDTATRHRTYRIEKNNPAIAHVSCQARDWPTQQYVMEYINPPRTFEYDDVIWLDDDEEKINLELALSKLLEDEVLFANNARDPETICLYVNCSDVFSWGVTDAENICTNELMDLYKLYYIHRIWGAIKWVCFKRNQKPQTSVIEKLKNAGIWDDQLEALPDN